MDCLSCPNANTSQCKVLPIQETFSYNKEIYSKPTNVVLGLTARCNLSCPYCFVNQHNQDMDLETARNAIQIVLKNGKEQGIRPQVIFFGGEPLLKFEEIIVPITEEFYKEVDFGITTNGVLLDEDKVDFFYQHSICPLLSFDGVKIVQDSQRPGKNFSSFDKIVRNIPYFLFRFPEGVMRATITKASIPHLYESFCWAEEIGFLKTAWCVNSYEEWSEEDANIFQEEIDKISIHVYEKLLKGERAVEVRFLQSAVESLEKYYTSGLKFNNAMKRCGLASTTFSVCPNGDIAPCQEKISCPTWIVGNVNNGGIDCKKHEEFLNWYWNKIHTLTCKKDCPINVRAFCLSNTCPSRLEDQDFKMSSSHCWSTKKMYMAAERLRMLSYGSIIPTVNRYFYGGANEKD